MPALVSPTSSCVRRGLSRIATSVLLAAGVAAQAPAPFDRQQLTGDYFAEGAAIGDFNRDGHGDVTSGPWWWEGPTFAVRHGIYAGGPAAINAYSPHFTSHVVDLNADGWDDILVIGFPGQAAFWFENPQNAGGPWPQHLVARRVDTEAPALRQLIPGGLPELVCGTAAGLGYFTPEPTAPTQPWTFHPAAPSPTPLTFLHGLGTGDINGDGREDILTGIGWLEQPPSLVGDPTWPFHSFSVGTLAGAQMFTDDVDGDGDQDLISSISAHGYGLSWFENTLVAGTHTFTQHVILPRTPSPAAPVQFSQLHGLDLVDVDGDGLRDIVTGKTWLAHNGADPGANDPAVLYWFRLDRSGATPTYVPHRIDDDSGVGRQVVVGDINDDGRPDVVTGNKKGVFVFSRANLWADQPSISVATGGRQDLHLDFGAGAARLPYLIVGSASGTSPGVTVAGVPVPLNPDTYTTLMLGTVNGPIFPAFDGMLDATGRANAAIVLPPAFPAPTPFEAHHAVLLFDTGGRLTRASTPVSVGLR